jgi:hypothetical protein
MENRYKTILILVGLVVLLILAFYLGYLYGNRELKEQSYSPKVTTILSNGNQENSLTQIKIKDIISFDSNKNKQSYGKFYYIVKDSGEDANTDLLFKLENVPSKTLNQETKAEKEIPLEMNIDLATRTVDGQGFEYENIGKAKFIVNAKKELKLEFSGVVNFALDQRKDKQVQRIVFRPTSQDQTNVFVDRDSALPIKIRGDDSSGLKPDPAPYFWVEI